MRSITQRSYGLHPGGILSLPATPYATAYTLLQGFYNKVERVGGNTFQNFFTFNNRGFFSATGQFFKIVLAHKPVLTTMFRAINHFPDVFSNSGKISVVSCRQLIHKQVSHSIDSIGVPNLENILHFPLSIGKEISRPLKVIGIGSIGYFVGRVVGYKVKDCCLNNQYPYTNTAVTSSFSVYNFRRNVKHGLKHPDREVITRGQFPKRTQFWEIKKPANRVMTYRLFSRICFYASIPIRVRISLAASTDTNIKQFLNYQGVVIEKSGRKTGRNVSENHHAGPENRRSKAHT